MGEKAEKNIGALLKEMTLAEKASLLAGADMWHSTPIERLGIPAFKMTDGPNGVRGADDILGPTSVCFPVGVALGATWNMALAEKVGSALAQSVKAKNGHVLLAPTVNIARTPIAGRNFECYAEDPYLSGMIASAFIEGSQNVGVAACIKHFVANDQEFERFSISAEVGERALHEIYLEPFRLAIQNANPWSVMSAYNRINGEYASENRYLLGDILKEEWAYDGVVISDWYGVYSRGALFGGLDLEMPGPSRFVTVDEVVEAVKAGELDEAEVEDKVRRLLRLIERTGARERSILQDEAVRDMPADRTLARRAATEAIVLLKNDERILPLDLARIKKIAVIGENAKWAQIMGGGSSSVNPHYAVSPLEGIQNRVNGVVDVAYEIGTPIHQQPPLLDPSWLTANDGQENGWTLSYFDNLGLEGEAIKKATISKTYLAWFGTVNPHIDPANFSLRLSGVLTVPESKDYEFHLMSIGKSRLVIDGETQIDNWDYAAGDGEQSGSVALNLRGGQSYSVVMEYSSDPDARWRALRLGCSVDMADDPILAAVDLAAQSDVAIVVVGLTPAWESEGFDRANMELVGRQNELVSRVIAGNPNTIVVVNAGSPVEMPWSAESKAILQSWYLGQESGNALADILFGDANPSGKLPITFPQRLEDNPAFVNYPGENGRVHYGEGVFVGYRYYDKKRIKPLFPFGFGLSYTTFEYRNLQLRGEMVGADDLISVSVDVTNTGKIAGQEIVQLYMRDLEAKVARPLKELKGFAKIELEAGETKTVTLTLDQQALAFYDDSADKWVTEAGEFELLIGGSSRNLPVRCRFSLATGTVNVDKKNERGQLSTTAI